MTLLPNIFQSLVISSLDTYNHICEQTSMYTVNVVMTMIPPSGLSVIIEKNGSPVASSVAPSSAQSNINLQAQMNCSQGDTLSIVISSSNPQDTQLNDIKGIIAIAEGPVP